MIAESQQPSVASLTQKISVLTAGKQQWEVDTLEVLGPIQALRDYASVLRTTLSQVEATVALLQEECKNRLKVLFDEPMDELRKEIAAERDEYKRMLSEDIITPSPQHCTIPERIPPMCVLFETHAAVNGERMRLPPDVMEGVIPMVGLGGKIPRVFYRAVTSHDVDREVAVLGPKRRRVTKYFLPNCNCSRKALTSILRHHKWGVVQEASSVLSGVTHFYDNAGNAQSFIFFRFHPFDAITIYMERSMDEPLVTSIVENVMSDIGGGQDKGSYINTQNKT